MIVAPNCPDCGAENVVDRGRLGELRSGTIAGVPVSVESGSIYRCNSCALAFRYPCLPAQDYVQAYEQLTLGYWSAHSYCEYWLSVEGLLFQDERSPNSILDIGCYTGDFLRWIKERHPEVSISGVEPATQASQIAASAGVEMLGSDIRALSSAERRFDVVVLFDVFEHLPDISESLDLALKVLNTGGVILIYSGNFDARSWRFMGRDYYYTAIPEHVVFFSPKWCRRFAVRKKLELVTIRHLSNNTGSVLTIADQTARGLLFRASRVFERNGLSFLNKLPLFRKSSRWNTPPVMSAARDHLLAVFRKK